MSSIRIDGPCDHETFVSCLSNDTLHLVLLPTEACNFRCSYCYERFACGRMERWVLHGIEALLARRAPSLRVLTLSWFGGEPLLARDLVEETMLHAGALARANPGLRLRSDMTTNGSLLSPAVAERLIALGVTRFQISFDPPRERHDRLRLRANGRPTFDRIWRNVLALRESPRDFTVTLRTHVDRDNAACVPEFIDRCASAFGTDPRYEIFIRGLARLGGSSDPDLPVFEREEGEAVFEQLRAYARGRGLRTLAAAPPDAICYAAKGNSYVVRADGRLAKCTVALDHPCNDIGRIHEDGTVEVDARALGRWMRGIWSGDPEERRCPKIGLANAPAGVVRAGASRPARIPTLSALLLAFAAVTAAPGGSAGAPAPADSSIVAPRPTLEEIHHWNQIGRHEDAERAARNLLAETERAHGLRSVEAAEVLDELAVALRRGGAAQEPELLEICERAVAIKTEAYGRDDPRVATSLHNLGMVRYLRKEFDLARTLLLEALEIQKASLGSNDPRIAKTLLALGAVHQDSGDYEGARPFTEQGVAIEEIALGAGNPERAHGLNALAVLRYRLGDFSGAIPLYEEALSLSERSATPNWRFIADCSHNLGIIYDEIGDHARAVELIERAIRIHEEPGSPTGDGQVAVWLGALGSALEGLGDTTRAKEAFQRSIRLYTAADPADPDVAWPLAHLGWLHLDAGEVDLAADVFTRSLRIEERVSGPPHPCLWITLRGLAMVSRIRGDPDAAEANYVRAVNAVRELSGPAHPDMGVTLVEYASFQLAIGESLAAFDTALRAAQLNREHMRLTVAGLTERQALLLTSGMETGLDVAFAALSGAPVVPAVRSEESIRRLWDALVRSRALVLDEIGGRARWVEGAGEVLELAKGLEAARSRLANLMVRDHSAEDPERTREIIERARAEVDAGERALAMKSALFRADVDRATIGLDRVLTNLPRGAALVSYATYGRGPDREYAGLVAARNRSLTLIPLGAADEVDRGIARWRTLAGTPPPERGPDAARAEQACREVGKSLRIRIWDPLERALEGATIVFVVPEGPIHLINLAALPGPGIEYLVESPITLHYVSAERDIVRAARVHSHGAGLLAVGNPSFDRPESIAFTESEVDVSGSDPKSAQPVGGAQRSGLEDRTDFRSVRFAALPETDHEIDEIVALWKGMGGVILLKGERAGERSVKDLLPGRKVAHIATHGFFLPGTGGPAAAPEPMRTGARGIGGIARVTKSRPRAPDNPFRLSGLALAGANLRDRSRPGEEDGILLAEEIASLDLSTLDWVVLSACKTGLGEVSSGEGVLGLRRAFQIAGAGTLIMSLWAVEDRSTRDWMRRLYDGRLKGTLETAEAVREADLGVLRSLRAQGRSTHPFYWAAFIAAGDWR